MEDELPKIGTNLSLTGRRVRSRIKWADGWCGLSGHDGWCGLSGHDGWCGLSGHDGWCGLSGLTVGAD